MAVVDTIPERTQRQMADMYLAGAPAKDVDAAFGFHTGVCAKVLQRLGIPARGNTQRRHEVALEELRRGARKCRVCGEYKPLSLLEGGGVGATAGVKLLCRDCAAKRRGRRSRYKPPDVSLTPEQAAYLAGLLDGEGHFGLIKLLNNGPRGYCYSVRIGTGMASSVLVELYDELKVGRVFYKKRPDPRHKDMWFWNIGANGGRALLPLLMPYLRVKKRQAELLMVYLQLAAHSPKGYSHLMAERTDKYDQIYQELKVLNRRGK